MVVWTKKSVESLKQICRYIVLDSVFYSRKVKKDIIAAVESVSLFPNSGRVVPEISQSNIREIFLYSYRLVYQIREKDIIVMRILHVRQKSLKEEYLSLS